MMSGLHYVCLFQRLMHAVSRMDAMQAAVCGMHFARWWDRKQQELRQRNAC